MVRQAEVNNAPSRPCYVEERNEQSSGQSTRSRPERQIAIKTESNTQPRNFDPVGMRASEDGRIPSYPETSQGSKTKQSQLMLRLKWDYFLVAVTTAIFAVTAWLAQSTFSVSSMDSMK